MSRHERNELQENRSVGRVRHARLSELYTTRGFIRKRGKLMYSCFPSPGRLVSRNSSAVAVAAVVSLHNFVASYSIQTKYCSAFGYQERTQIYLMYGVLMFKVVLFCAGESDKDRI